MVGELALLFLEVENSLFDTVFDGDFVDYYVDFLGEAVDAVDGLFFDELGFISKGSVRCEGFDGDLRDSRMARESLLEWPP